MVAGQLPMEAAGRRSTLVTGLDPQHAMRPATQPGLSPSTPGHAAPTASAQVRSSRASAHGQEHPAQPIPAAPAGIASPLASSRSCGAAPAAALPFLIQPQVALPRHWPQAAAVALRLPHSLACPQHPLNAGTLPVWP